MVRVSTELEVAPTGMLVGVNDLVMVGAVTTVRVDEAVVPVPPFVALTVPVVLV